MTSDRNRALAQRIRNKDFIAAPGVFELISAKIADTMGFDALYMTGFGVVASYLGLPDAGLATYTEMVGAVERIARQTKTPLICDGDTGYGGLLNVEHTVRGYERAGAAAIQLEDQVFPKKCGATPGRRVVPLAEAVAKIRVALDSRDSEDFLIVARTDARTNYGLDEALRRGEAFAKAGADMLFIEAPESAEEMEKIARTFDTPLLANMGDGMKYGGLTKDDLQKMGYTVAIYPGVGMLAAGHALRDVYQTIRRDGSPAKATSPRYDFKEFCLLMGFQHVWDFEKKWAGAEDEDIDRAAQ